MKTIVLVVTAATHPADAPVEETSAVTGSLG
jgi:tetrahydromethanopterin S-methyltransferase subunit A